MTSAGSETDVIIIGGGPTGLSLAIELASQNISFRIIDKERSRSDKSRALVVQPRTLELFNRLGTIDYYIAQGNNAIGGYFHINKKRIAEIRLTDLGLTDTAFDRPLFISQVETEQFLDSRLSEYDKEVERGITVEEITPDNTGVSLALTHPGGEKENLRAKYIVGADGAHSIVRRAAGLKFEGGTYAQNFILCDVHIRWDQPTDHMMIFLTRGLMVILPMKGDLVRIICVGLELKESTEGEPTLEDFQAHFNALAPGKGELYDPIWITRFRLHHRAVDNYRSGRLFVAGDAAHIHSPAGGQGMNTGIQDAINLGWKLAAVLRGEKDDAFLDTYNAERRPIGQTLLKGTDKIFEWASWGNPVYVAIRNTLLPWVLPWILSSRHRRAKAFKFILEFGIHYRWSPIVGNAYGWRGPIRGGDRAPDGRVKDRGESKWLLELCRGPRYKLILFSGVLSNATNEEELTKHEKNFSENNSHGAERVTLYGAEPVGRGGVLDVKGNLHSRYGFSKPGYVYIRPDGYVAFIGGLTTMDEFLALMRDA